MQRGKVDKSLEDSNHTELDNLDKNPGNFKPDSILVVLPDDERPLYDSVKRQCDIELGIQNICLVSNGLASNQNGYYLQWGSS